MPISSRCIRFALHPLISRIRLPHPLSRVTSNYLDLFSYTRIASITGALVHEPTETCAGVMIKLARGIENIA